jgi:hypothetical protein
MKISDCPRYCPKCNGLMFVITYRYDEDKITTFASQLGCDNCNVILDIPSQTWAIDDVYYTNEQAERYKRNKAFW